MERNQSEQKVFMLNDANFQGQDYSMDYFYSMEKPKAEQLINEGKAISYGHEPELDNYDKEIEKLTTSFRKKYDELKNSKDPRYKDEEFFADEVGKLKKELDAETARLQGEYETIVKDIREQAQHERANLVRNVSSTDEKGASQLINELASEAKLNGIDKALSRIENDMKYYSEGRKVAIANELHKLVDVAGDDRKAKRQLRSLYNKLRADDNGIELAARMAEALPTQTGSSYSRLKVTHPAYKRR